MFGGLGTCYMVCESVTLDDRNVLEISGLEV